MDQAAALQFYTTGFWTLAGIVATGIAMLFVFYRWCSTFTEKINARITEVELEHTEKVSDLERVHADKLAEMEREQMERINRVEKQAVSKKDCNSAGAVRTKPLLIEIEHLKSGQESLTGEVRDLSSKVGELAENVAALVSQLNGKLKG